MLFPFFVLFGIMNLFFIYNKVNVKIFRDLFFVLLAIIMVFNNYNPDYLPYFNRYNMNIGEHEILYTWLVHLGNRINISFTMFHGILVIIGLILIYRTVLKLIGDTEVFFLLYAIYPFAMDVVQFRNFLAMAIIFYSFPLLLTESKFNKLRYVVLIIFASGFQIISFVYLIFIFIKPISSNRFIKGLLIYGIVILLIFTLQGRVLIQILENVINFNLLSLDTRFSEFLRMDISTRGFWIYWGIHFVNIIFAYWGCKINGIYGKKIIFIKNNQVKSDEDESKNIFIFILWINILLTLFLPLYLFQSTFIRIMRNIMPINYIGFLMTLKNYNRKIIYKLFYVLYIVGLFWFDIYLGYADKIVFPLFTKSLLF